MTRFFEDPRAFRRELHTRPDPAGRCWSCPRRRPLVGVPARRDLETLGVPSDGCPEQIVLCPTCIVAYMNSFNGALSRKQGREDPGEHWTVQGFVDWMYGTRPGV
jgi:hypothetical protein